SGGRSRTPPGLQPAAKPTPVPVGLFFISWLTSGAARLYSTSTIQVRPNSPYSVSSCSPVPSRPGAGRRLALTYPVRGFANDFCLPGSRRVMLCDRAPGPAPGKESPLMPLNRKSRRRAAPRRLPVALVLEPLEDRNAPNDLRGLGADFPANPL